MRVLSMTAAAGGRMHQMYASGVLCTSTKVSQQGFPFEDYETAAQHERELAWERMCAQKRQQQQKQQKQQEEEEAVGGAEKSTAARGPGSNQRN